MLNKLIIMECSKNGIKREGESCTLNNNCTYPDCIKEEIEKCKNFEYFYNNYCKTDNMPEYSEEVYKNYLKMAEERRYVIGRTRGGNDLRMRPLTPNECYERTS